MSSTSEGRSPLEGSPQPARAGGSEAAVLPPGIARRLLAASRPHRGRFLRGAVFTVAGVACHLSLPLALSAWVGLLAGEASGFGPISSSSGMAFTFVALMAVIGLCEHGQRLAFARFAIGWSRELRQTAFAAMMSRHQHEREPPGEVVATLIADVARFKAGVKVFLTYVASNLLLLLGAMAVLLWTDVGLGAVFAAAIAATLGVAMIGARGSLRAYWGFRGVEARLASALEGGGAGVVDDLRQSSSAAEAAEARVNGRTTLAAHVIVGAAVLGSLLVGARSLSAGRIEPSAMLIFLGYVFLLGKPLVRLARHGARTGKVLACAARLVSMSEDGRMTAQDGWAEGGRLKVEGPDRTVTLERGDRLLVVGPPGCGKTTWLRRVSDGAAPGEVGFLEQEVTWRRQSVRSILGVDTKAAAHARLSQLGVGHLASDLGDALDARVSAKEFSFAERRALRLARLLDGSRELLLLDDPLEGAPAAATPALEEQLDADRTRTWVVSSSVPLDARRFDRVLELDGGRVVSLADSEEWVARSSPDRVWGKAER